MFHTIRGSLALVFILLNTIVHVVPLYTLALLKLLPVEPVRVFLSKGLVIIAESWIAVNTVLISLFSGVRLNVEGVDSLNKNQWYLVTSNHTSWADILVLQSSFNRRIPFLKFFIKQELIKVPLLGLAWWALDFPFMKRYSKAELERNPELKGTDLETTKEKCQKFARFPTSVMNFFEGTRFSEIKHQKQQSPYKHLLKPKSGGTAFTLSAMSGQLGTLLDITLIYPRGIDNELISYLGGRVKSVDVIVKQHVIPEWASQGDYENDSEFRTQFQKWISDIWQAKDDLIENRLSK